MCGLYFINKLLPKHCHYRTNGLSILSRSKDPSHEIDIIAILMKELSLPMHDLASHLSEQEETFLTKLETKEVLYKRISNECSKIIHLSDAKLPGKRSSAYESWKWFEVISAAKDQEFHEICHMLKDSLEAYSETVLVNQMDITSGESLSQESLMGDTPSGGAEESKGNG